VKLTALADWAAVGVFLLLDGRRRVEAGWFCLMTVLGVMAAFSAGVVVFGDAFVVEVFLFHTLKGVTGSLGERLWMLRRSLDVAGVMGLGGLGLLLSGQLKGKSCGRDRTREGTILIALLLGARLVFLLFFSPTFWAHNAIPFLIPLSWAGGVFAVRAVRALGEAVRRPGAVTGARALAVAGWLVLGFLVFPLRNDQWRLGSVYGFGYQDRGEIRRIAGSAREHSEPEARIVAPPAVAVEARRVKLVHYREVAGPVAVIRDAIEKGRLGELRRNLRDAEFFDTLFRSLRVVGEEIEAAIRARSVPVVVPDSRFSLVSEVRVRESFLEEQGYREVLATEHYGAWALPDRPRTSPTR